MPPSFAGAASPCRWRLVNQGHEVRGRGELRISMLASTPAMPRCWLGNRGRPKDLAAEFQQRAAPSLHEAVQTDARNLRSSYSRLGNRVDIQSSMVISRVAGRSASRRATVDFPAAIFPQRRYRVVGRSCCIVHAISTVGRGQLLLQVKARRSDDGRCTWPVRRGYFTHVGPW
jgi:hypothetical protein